MPSTDTNSVRHILGLVTGDEELGRRIRTARLDVELTQAQLAHRIGLHDAQSVSNYERAVTDVPRDRLRKIAAETRKPMSYFIDEPADVIDPIGVLAKVAHNVEEIMRAQDLQFALLEELRARLDKLSG